MERAHRIGKKERDDSSQKRTIIAKFLNYKDKEYCESTGLANVIYKWRLQWGHNGNKEGTIKTSKNYHVS